MFPSVFLFPKLHFPLHRSFSEFEQLGTPWSASPTPSSSTRNISLIPIILNSRYEGDIVKAFVKCKRTKPIWNGVLIKSSHSNRAVCVSTHARARATRLKRNDRKKIFTSPRWFTSRPIKWQNYVSRYSSVRREREPAACSNDVEIQFFFQRVQKISANTFVD